MGIINLTIHTGGMNMDKTWKWIGIALFIGLFITLAACTTPNPRADEANELNPNAEQTKSVYDNPPDGAEDLTDPLFNSDKSENKTKTHDKTDTPNIRENSISSHFESILKGQGIKDVKVFNVDNSVILAQTKAGKTSHDHLNQAQTLMDNMLNGNIKILTATDPQAASLISRIEKNIENAHYQEASDDILELLNMTE